MQKWEYKVTSFPVQDREDVLSELGEKGWELCVVVHSQAKHQGEVVHIEIAYFKRPKD